MCSIMGYCSRSAAFDAFKKGFDKTILRGPDDSRIVDTEDGLLGFHKRILLRIRLHSRKVVGRLMMVGYGILGVLFIVKQSF